MIQLGPEKAVYSILLPEVKAVLTDSIKEFYVHSANKEYLNNNRQRIIKNFRCWIKDIADLSEFHYAYPISGITESINQWLIDYPGSVELLDGEYGWINVQRPHMIGDNTSKYISSPFSATGDFLSTNKIESTLPTFLDCAFVGSTAKTQITIPKNVQCIAFGFSKGFGVNLFRTGFLFTRTKHKSLDTWLGPNYHNVVGMHVADKIMQNFDVDYVYNKLRSTQLQICSDNNLTPSDSVFIAKSTDVTHEYYKRGDGTFRICLSREYVMRGLGSFYL